MASEQMPDLPHELYELGNEQGIRAYGLQCAKWAFEQCAQECDKDAATAKQMRMDGSGSRTLAQRFRGMAKGAM